MRLMIVLSSSPYNNLNFQEGLDLALTQAAMGHEVGIVLQGLAVHALKEPISEKPAGRRNLARMLASAPLYDMTTLCVLRTNSCSLNSLPPSWCWLESKDVHDFLESWDEVLFW